MSQTRYAVLEMPRMNDLMMSGEAARLMDCDKRTFLARAEKHKILPVQTLKGNKKVFRRKDVDRLIEIVKKQSEAA